MLPLLWAVIWNMLVYFVSRRIAGNWHHYNMETVLDRKIPLISWTVLIYFGCYLFWIVNYVYCSRQGKKEAWRFLSADFLAKFVCLFFFLVVPTTNVRPEITGNGIWDQLMLLLYRVDAADNLFPSIHCLVSWFCYIGLRGRKTVPFWYRTFSCGMAIAVCISTLTTRQHVLVDVAGGILLAEGCYRITEVSGFAAFYGSIFEKLTGYLGKS